MGKFLRLDNETWVDPSDISGVSFWDHFPHGSNSPEPAVTVTIKGGNTISAYSVNRESIEKELDLA